MAEASPTLVPVISNSACHLCRHLGRVLLPVVRTNGAGYQRTIRPDDRREHPGLNRTRRRQVDDLRGALLLVSFK